MANYDLFLENEVLYHASYWYFRGFNLTESDEKRDKIDVSETRYPIDYFIYFRIWWFTIWFHKCWKQWMEQPLHPYCSCYWGRKCNSIYNQTTSNVCTNVGVSRI